MKTLDELRDLAIRWALDYISHHQAQSRVNLDGIGSGLATAQRFEEESKRALDDALRELIADAERMQWLRSAKNLDLRWMPSEWRRPDGSMFVAPYLLRAGDTQYAPEESLDAAIDAARKG